MFNFGPRRVGQFEATIREMTHHLKANVDEVLLLIPEEDTQTQLKYANAFRELGQIEVVLLPNYIIKVTPELMYSKSSPEELDGVSVTEEKLFAGYVVNIKE